MKRDIRSQVLLFAVTVTAVFAVMGCGLFSPSPASRLRVTNKGPAGIQQLTLAFPNHEIFFGDIAAGASTPYHDVPGGVYGYAGYRFSIGGVIVREPPIDFVGEKPLDGKVFTYEIEVDANRSPVIRLVSVTRDE